MNHFNWIYLADNGKRHHVGLMHGATSGHLLVYCNSKIVIIDFQVLKTSKYSFFIEEELCELTIERQGDRFLYGFEVNQDADTPHNRRRKKREKKHLIQSLLFVGGLIVFLTLFITTITNYQSNRSVFQLQDKLAISGKETHARILNIPSDQDNAVSYFFMVNGSSYSLRSNSPYEQGQFLLQTGMPLEVGDEFKVRYLPSNPYLCEIDFTQPTKNTLASYKERAIDKYRMNNPDEDPDYCNCLADIAFDLNGINGYADIYFMDTSPGDNPNHNSDSFKRLTRDLPFQKLLQERCQ